MARTRADIRARLVLLARIASASDIYPAERAATRRLMRWQLQELAGELLPEQRVALCLKHKVPGKKIELWRNAKLKTASMRNLMRCASVWHCPICSSKITEERKLEISDVLAESPHTKVMVTFTLAHTRGMTLVDLVEKLNQAYRFMKSGRSWQRFESDAGIVGSIRGMEVTAGQATGWHPHFHVLFFLDFPPHKKQPDFDRIFSEWISKAWAHAVEKQSGYASLRYGTNCIFDQQKAVGEYIAKSGESSWGLDAEIAKSPAKLGTRAAAYSGNLGAWLDKDKERYTGFQLLLESALAGNDNDAIRWFENHFIEYAAVMKGRHQLQWSPGLRDLFGLDAEKNDEELANQNDEMDSFFSHMPDDVWSKILKTKNRGQLLELVARGDKNHLRVWLSGLGVKDFSWLE